MLLNVVKCPTQFEHLRTVDGEICSAYRQAGPKLGLLEGDQHWNAGLSKACAISMPNQMRLLFVIISSTCALFDPSTLMGKHRDSLNDDYLQESRIVTNSPDLQMSDIIYNQALMDIEDICMASLHNHAKTWK